MLIFAIFTEYRYRNTGEQPSQNKYRVKTNKGEQNKTKKTEFAIDMEINEKTTTQNNQTTVTNVNKNNKLRYITYPQC